MATYVVGDIQGCLKPLRCLLKKVRFSRKRDRLISVGDVVNRGPQSLETLRYLKGLGSAFSMVLGNHDLHLLAIHRGAAKPSRKDTFNTILAAEDRDELCDWLQRQPIIIQEDGNLLVHAGIPPIWSTDQALSLAEEVENALRGGDAFQYFQAMYGNKPDRWAEDLAPPTRWRVITNYLTRMRFCSADGTLDLSFKGAPKSAPAGYSPWFEHPSDRQERIVFGHWAALSGDLDSEHFCALDTGCVWGGALRLLHLESGDLFECECRAGG
ncbi:MAG: symmetrical bis(5'-nucleosyl)-tetraphosphatase [bacterium]